MPDPIEVKRPAMGGIMEENPRERRKVLFQQAVTERDPQKLRELILEICVLLRKDEFYRKTIDHRDGDKN